MKRRRNFLLGFVLLTSNYFVHADPTGADPSKVVSPLRKIHLSLDWFPQAENAGYFCAEAEGYYKNAGLDVDFISASTINAVEPSVALGKSEFGLSNTDRILMARSHGLPLVAVLASLQHDATAVMVHEDSPVKTFPDLEGHTLAIPPGASWFPFLVHKYHFTHIRTIPLNFENLTFATLPDYIEECLVTAEPYYMEQHQIKIRTLLIMDAGCDPYRVLMTSDVLMAKDPQLVRAFVKASQEGWRHYLVDPMKTDQEILRRNQQMTQGQLDFSRKALIDGHFISGFPERHESVGSLSVDRFTAQYQVLRSIQILDHDFDYHQAFTTQFLEP